MIQPDLAKFIDNNGGASQRLMPHQAIEHSRLSTAEKAGQHGDGNFAMFRQALAWSRGCLVQRKYLGTV